MFVLKSQNNKLYKFSFISSTIDDIVELSEVIVDSIDLGVLYSDEVLDELSNIEHDHYISKDTMKLIDFLNINYILYLYSVPYNGCKIPRIIEYYNIIKSLNYKKLLKNYLGNTFKYINNSDLFLSNIFTKNINIKLEFIIATLELYSSSEINDELIKKDYGDGYKIFDWDLIGHPMLLCLSTKINWTQDYKLIIKNKNKLKTNEKQNYIEYTISNNISDDYYEYITFHMSYYYLVGYDNLLTPAIIYNYDLLPKGSWIESAIFIEYNNNILYFKLYKINKNINDTSNEYEIKLGFDTEKYYNNLNGEFIEQYLIPQKYNMISGSWINSCKNVLIKNNIINADLMMRDGNWNKTKFYFNEKNNYNLINNNGEFNLI